LGGRGKTLLKTLRLWVHGQRGMHDYRGGGKEEAAEGRKIKTLHGLCPGGRKTVQKKAGVGNLDEEDEGQKTAEEV